MTRTDNPPNVVDEVISEIRAIERTISESYGNAIDRLLDALIRRERTAGIGQAEHATTRPEAKSEGGENPQMKGRSH
jgi:hypothetical protein